LQPRKVKALKPARALGEYIFFFELFIRFNLFLRHLTHTRGRM
jgi:hypothetical protein